MFPLLWRSTILLVLDMIILIIHIFQEKYTSHLFRPQTQIHHPSPVFKRQPKPMNHAWQMGCSHQGRQTRCGGRSPEDIQPPDQRPASLLRWPNSPSYRNLLPNSWWFRRIGLPNVQFKGFCWGDLDIKNDPANMGSLNTYGHAFWNMLQTRNVAGLHTRIA